MAMAANSYSQETRFDLTVKNASIIQVFDEIERVSDYGFLFKTDQLDLSKQYTLDIKNSNIDKILKEILDQNEYSYRLIDRNIVITRIGSESNQDGKTIKVSGKVTDSSGEPIPGVTVLVKGTTNGTISDGEGKYSLPNVPVNGTLQFSFVGMKTQEVVVGSNSTINVTLAEETFGIDEVVAIGYGTIKKGDVTSAISSVKSEDFVKGSVKDIGQLIQGKVAGLTVSSPSGDPTSGTQIKLRGSTTIYGTSTNPLVLIDGVPDDFNTVAPEDIESIDVLKDGSAAAIYGTRGTNGVILITTKRASGNFASSVEYSGYMSTQNIASKLDMLTAADYRQQIAAGTRPASDDLGASTDWLKEITRTPFSHVQNLTFRGGSAKTNYLATVNYRDLEGIFKKSDNNQVTARTDINHNMFDNLLSFNLGLLTRSNKYNTSGDGTSFNGYTYRQALIYNPTSPVKNADGSWVEQPGAFNYDNPLSRLEESDGENSSQFSRLMQPSH